VLETAAAQLPPGAHGLLALPYWTGALTPYWDHNARGVLLGLTGGHGKSHVYRALLESMAYEQRMLTTDAERASGRTIDELVTLGGGSRSPVWCQMIADVMQRDVLVVREPESTRVGAGMLAAAAVGLHGSIREAADAISGTARRFVPDQDRAAAYGRALRRVPRHLPVAVHAVPPPGRGREDGVTRPAPAAPTAAPTRLYDGYLFDLDGTIYLGDELLPGAQRLVERLRELGRAPLFLTNNPTRDPQTYADKLTRLGLPTPAGAVVNTVLKMKAWLLRHAPGAGVFVIGEEPLCRALAAAGVRLTERPEEIDVVVASYDRTFDCRKLQIAFDALWQHRQARLVTTNPDAYCPVGPGRGEPDAAAITAAIEAATGVRCEVNVGKPSRIVLERIDDLLPHESWTS